MTRVAVFQQHRSHRLPAFLLSYLQEQWLSIYPNNLNILLESGLQLNLSNHYSDLSKNFKAFFPLVKTYFPKQRNMNLNGASL